jgi:hypothetical protein
MDKWDFDDFWWWDDEEEETDFLYEWSEELADRFFLSNNDYLPNAGDDYSLGHLEPEAWWPVVNQLDEMVDVEAVVSLTRVLENLLRLPGLPTELLEAPLVFLESVLDGKLPLEPSGRRVNSRRLVKIAQAVTQLLRVFPEAAQAAVRAWADVHRQLAGVPAFEPEEEEDWSDLLTASDLPPPVTGFSMMVGLTLMRWPERAEGMPLPPGFLEPGLYDEVLSRWEALPDSPSLMEEGAGEAEALFAQGQLAHMLAQMGTVELLASDEMGEIDQGDLALAYSRLSRAVLWMHHQCRHCPERDGVACKVATNWSECPVPLLDVGGEIANTGRILGCIRM